MPNPTTPPECDEIEVTLDRFDDRAVLRSVLRYLRSDAPAPGDPITTSRPLPFSPGEVSGRLTDLARVLRRRNARGSESISDVQLVGAALFDGLFGGAAQRLYTEARARADATRAGLRVRLVFPQDDRLQRGRGGTVEDLPWEALYDTMPDRNDFLALCPRVAIVRSCDSTATHDVIDAPSGVLVVALEREGQAAAIDQAIGELRSLDAAGRAQVEVLRSPTADQLERALRATRQPIVHLIGATEDVDGDAYLTVAPQEGAPIAASARQLRPVGWLADTLRGHDTVRLVFVQAAGSARFAGGLFPAVPAVVGMRELAADATVQSFVTTFLRAIFAGERLEVAANTARRQVDAGNPGSRDWALPVLYVDGANGGLPFARNAPWPEHNRPSDPGLLINKTGFQGPPEAYLASVRAQIAQANLRELKTRLVGAGDGCAFEFLRQQIAEETRRLRENNELLHMHGAKPLAEDV